MFMLLENRRLETATVPDKIASAIGTGTGMQDSTPVGVLIGGCIWYLVLETVRTRRKIDVLGSDQSNLVCLLLG